MCCLRCMNCGCTSKIAASDVLIKYVIISNKMGKMHLLKLFYHRSRCGFIKTYWSVRPCKDYIDLLKLYYHAEVFLDRANWPSKRSLKAYYEIEKRYSYFTWKRTRCTNTYCLMLLHRWSCPENIEAKQLYVISLEDWARVGKAIGLRLNRI
jgi:hypothetical protein